ncbi:PAS domain-containing sensor histidine kinase [Allosphingosinicella deserti]|uniref:histidine kinase n=1 Tax=Allosphingosinicella deserti TaxID=2116704 RepID=A0A2P7QZN8_9SPHN|nr:ATP-binding protein [Sphingomonas deserti]PSJ43419.1 PAS domain-containing sensor histidine kinase [Sphingomonas deserti]
MDNAFDRDERSGPSAGGAPGGISISGDELRRMVDAVPAVLCYFDTDLVCRFANRYLEEWYLRTPEWMVGKSLREIIGEEDFAARSPHLERARRGEISAFTTFSPLRNGTYRQADVRYVPRMGPDGFEGLYILTFDVAELHHRFHSVFDGTALGFWIVDLAILARMLGDAGVTDANSLRIHLASDPDFVRRALDRTPVVAINAKAAEMFDIEIEAARGQPFGRWCCEASLPAFTQNLFAFLSGASSFETETVMAKSDGNCLDVALTCAFAKNAPGETAVIVGTTDISERIGKEHELARMQADLAHASRVATLGELTASIAHEVNQPLAAVLANGNAALRWLGRPDPEMEEVESAIRRMMSECSRAAEIITRTRALARKGVGTLTRVDLNQMVEDTVDIVRRQVSNLGAELALELADGLPRVEADRIQLQQVLINLVINSAQAMAERDGPRVVAVSTRAAAGHVEVAVSDTGPGVGDDPSQLFAAFFTTRETGMGMGLSVSKTIIEAHGGSIGACNRKGGGARFAFMLPAAA